MQIFTKLAPVVAINKKISTKNVHFFSVSDSHDIIGYYKRLSKRNLSRFLLLSFSLPLLRDSLDDLKLFVFVDVVLLCDILIVVQLIIAPRMFATAEYKQASSGLNLYSSFLRLKNSRSFLLRICGRDGNKENMTNSLASPSLIHSTPFSVWCFNLMK